jgi:cation diffusion facilitator family transporter
MYSPSLARFAWLSIGAAVLTIGLKAGAYLITGSVGLLSDAMESLVNLAAAIIALLALNLAARPPDSDHAYGHTKVEYFSSGIEGLLILVAAVSIGAASIDRLLNPRPVEQVGIGLAISLFASLINFGAARVLLHAGRQYRSITLEADAHHLMTDVWTSIGVVVGVGAVGLTGWGWLDPVIALIVAANIVWTGVRLVRRSTLGLIDTALPEADLAKIQQVLNSYQSQGIQTHALRTRQAGVRRFISFHVLVPNSTVFTHLEPVDEPTSFEDVTLDRTPGEPITR